MAKFDLGSWDPPLELNLIFRLLWDFNYYLPIRQIRVRVGYIFSVNLNITYILAGNSVSEPPFKVYNLIKSEILQNYVFEN